MNAEIAPGAGWKEWVGLATLALPTTLLALDASVLFLAAPSLSADLDPSSSQMLWIMDIYGFLIAGFLVTMGTLGDRIGRRKLLMFGASAFGAASVIAAFSTSAEMLIASRAVLGIAGVTLMPSTLALISNMFRNPAQRSFAIGVWMASFTVGLMIGPLVGGVLLEFFWWGSVFLMGVPIMVLLLATAPVLLPEYRDDKAGRLDPTSVALSLAAILPVVYGLKKIAESGLDGLPAISIVIGLAVGWAFLRRQRKLADPILDPSLFKNRAFSAALAIMLIGLGAMVGIEFFVAQYLQMVQGLSPFRAGMWMLPAAFGTLFGSLLTPIIARRVRPAYLIASGLALAAIGLLFITQVQSSSGLSLMITGVVVAFVGLSPVGVLGTNLVVGSAPPEKAGSASSLSETSQELGVGLGIAALGSVGTAVYRGRVADAMPSDIPPEAAQASRDTLGGALGAAERLPTGLDSELLEGAREAFTAGLTTAAAISALAMIVLAILAVAMLRQVPSSGEAEGKTDAQHNGLSVGGAGDEKVSQEAFAAEAKGRA